MDKYVYMAGHLLNTQTGRYIYFSRDCTKEIFGGCNIHLSNHCDSDNDIIKRSGKPFKNIEKLSEITKEFCKSKNLTICPKAKEFLKELVLDLSKNL